MSHMLLGRIVILQLFVGCLIGDWKIRVMVNRWRMFCWQVSFFNRWELGRQQKSRSGQALACVKWLSKSRLRYGGGAGRAVAGTSFFLE